MFNFVIQSQLISNGYNVETLYLLAFCALLCGSLVVTRVNPVLSVLYLIGLFVFIASILSILLLAFFALAYILVYVGAVSVLMLFIIMLINVKSDELRIYINNNLPLGLLIGLFFILMLIFDILGIGGLSTLNCIYVTSQS